MNKILPIVVLSLWLMGCTHKQLHFAFEPVNTPDNSSLRAICTVDEKTVWTSGSQGKVYLTVDGGVDWKAITVPGCEETEFRSLHAWDASRALVFDISPLGRAFMTEDAGQSWKQVYASPVKGAFFNSVKFADDLHGLAISDPVDEQVFVLLTEDGGLNWMRMENLPPAVPGEINFAASNTCIEYLPTGEIYLVTGGSQARILTSIDHGGSWTYVGTPVISGPSAGLFSIKFSSPKRGVAVGGDFNDPVREGVRAIYTEDGGEHWNAAQSMPAAYRSCVITLGKETSLAVGKTGCDYTLNGGKDWIFIDSAGYYAGDAVKGKKMLYLAGSDGRVAKVEFTRD